MSKTPFKTTFKEELLKEAKILAIELNCNVNEILEVGYVHLRKNWNNKEISKMINKNKEDK